MIDGVKTKARRENPSARLLYPVDWERDNKMAVCRLAVEFEAVFFRHGGTQGRFGKFARPGISRTLPCRCVSVSSRKHMVASTGGNYRPVRGGSSCVGPLEDPWKRHRRNFRTSAVVRGRSCVA